jgi:hypothetical protein
MPVISIVSRAALPQPSASNEPSSLSAAKEPVDTSPLAAKHQLATAPLAPRLRIHRKL